MAHIDSHSRSTAMSGARAWSFVDTLNRLNDLHRQRTALKKLDSSRLRDLGLTEADIEHELSQPIWTRL
ncbi:MAG: DUF1127 domain-containing protein [Pseudomonadota bacterium]